MELEHRSPKSRYRRTSRKQFVKQLTQIERRQACICRIHQKFNAADKAQTAPKHEKGPDSSSCDYHIGKTQNYPIYLDGMARENRHDPAAKVRRSLLLYVVQTFLTGLGITGFCQEPKGASH
jgi:hypothetical protein